MPIPFSNIEKLIDFNLMINQYSNKDDTSALPYAQILLCIETNKKKLITLGVY